MPSYTTVTAIGSALQLGQRCDECFCMVQDSDRWSHDQWHTHLMQGWVEWSKANHRLESDENDGEMLRRLLREVMELSERMDSDGS